MYKDKVIIITGATSGIGLACAKLFASYGAKLVLAARNAEKLSQLEKELDTDVLTVQTDVSDESQCREMVAAAVARFGRIDILVNNAGISMRAMFRDLDLSVIRSLMDTNFWGTVNCTKYALPYLLEAKGSVVGVISIAGFAGLPGRTGYSSSKFAIRGFLNTLRMEHLKDNLHVMVFAPGFTASNIRQTALTADGSPQGKTPREEGKMMTAEEVARKLARGIARRKSEMVLTPVGKLTVWLSKRFPRLTDRLEYMYMAKEPDSPFK
ncbi:MAG: SDR family oxidoreductase [Bacteroidales bacterium]|nr:SDR family oxidoreductase [Bacteroidales bacterium]